MFNFISWQSFLTITAIVIATYYAITALAFYHAEIRNWIRSLSNPSSQITAETKQTELENLMGDSQVTQPEQSIRTSYLSAEELITSGETEQSQITQTEQPTEHLLVGSLADLLEEVKTLIQLIAEYRTGMTESKALFNALFIRYPHLQPTSYPLAVSLYICDQAKGQFTFDLNSNEVMSWWNSSTSSNQNHQPKSI